MKGFMLGIALACVATAASAGDDPFLKRLEGDWVGRGMVRASATATPERLFCRLANALIDDGSGLNQTGRCALPDKSAPVHVELRAVGPGRYVGTADGIAGRPPAALAGTANARGMVLTATVPSGDSATVTTSDFSGSSFHLVAERVDPDTGATYTLGDVVFTRQ